MALRNIMKDGDEVLRKVCKPVDKINEKIITLLDDMYETMKKGNGVGLAGPQVGILKRVIVIDVGDGLIELINPEIVSREGEHVAVEGCLSVPGVWGEVKRPYKVKVKGLNRKGEEIEIKGEKLLAVVLCHEIDHLNGVLFTDKVIQFVDMDRRNK